MSTGKSATKWVPGSMVLQSDAIITSGYMGIITNTKSIGSSTNACATYARMVRPCQIRMVHSYVTPVSMTGIN